MAVDEQPELLARRPGPVEEGADVRPLAARVRGDELVEQAVGRTTTAEATSSASASLRVRARQRSR